MSSKVQPVNLKERIAALEQRNNASQWPSSPLPTSTNSSFLSPQTTGGALKDKIAKFEKKGGIPVPRGSFGLGAPPLAENAPAKRRGELYGNRIPSAVRSHITGPQLTGGVSTQITGPSPPNWADHRHSFALDGKIPGLEYDGHNEDTGGFEPPDSSLGQPQELSYASRASPPPVPTLSDPPSSEKVGVERRVASDSVRRGIPFASALELARKAETDKQGVYDPRSRETSLSPAHTGASNRQFSPTSQGDSLSTETTSPVAILSTGEAEIVEADSILKDKRECHDKATASETHTNRLQETIHNEDRDLLQGPIQQNPEEVFTTSISVSPPEVKIEHSSSPEAVLDETPPKTPNSDPLQSQSVVISLTTPEEFSTSNSHHTTSNVNITSEDVLIPTTEPPSSPKVVDKVPTTSGAEQVNGVVKPPDSPPTVPLSPAPVKLETESSHTAPPTAPTPAQLKTEVLATQFETFFQEAAPSETQVEVLTPHTEVVRSPVSFTASPNISGNESDSGASTGSTATIRDARGLNQDDEDDDSDLFVKPIKKRSPMNGTFEERSLAQNGGDKANSGEAPPPPPKDTSPDPNRLLPSTPSKSNSSPTSFSEDSLASLESSAARDSYMSQTSQTITLDSRPTSMMDSSSPGHVSFAQKISHVTSRGVPIFIPASSGKQTQTVKSTTSTTSTSPATSTSAVEPLQIQERSDIPEDIGTSEFGVVTIGGGSSTQRSHLRARTDTDTQKIQNRASTFSAVVHGKVRETQTFPVLSSKKAPSTPKKQQALSVEPMSPGFSELSLLMQQSALLESRLMSGDYPDESVGKREAVNRGAKGREKEKEQTVGEVTKLERTSTMNSATSGKNEGKKRKLSLKRTFGMGKSFTREASLPLESIPATPPLPPSGAGLKDMSRSKSMDTLRSTQPIAIAPPLPSFSLEPPPFPKPGKARSFHAISTDSKDAESSVPPATSSAASTSSTSGTGMDSDDVPPTPPPKSPSGKYLSSIRRFASSSRSHAGASSRSSVSNSSELSSDDSVIVVTPPDYSPNFASSKTVLETRTRTRSGSRSGRTILVGGAGTPPPSGVVDEDRASVITSASGSVKWPSLTSSPKKGGSMSRAASFAEKMFSRSRTKSNTSSVNSYDPSDRYATHEHAMSRAHPPSSMPALPPGVISQSPSLHELILAEPLTLSIPEMNEPQSPDPKSTPTVTRPPSWLSTSSAGTGSSSAYSRLLDKDFFDSFPPVPETVPPSHSRANSQNTVRTLQNSSLTS
ncbi:hypothetical protein L218DRAFT_498929 [Marasmius fiardii PR-910]|nr:hypothetical protein L218DRAFT_498929 [Marasmius fiardii PR-910]